MVALTRSGAGDAHADGSGGLIACAGDYGRASAQAGGFSARGGNFSADFGRLEAGQEVTRHQCRLASSNFF